MHNSIIETFLEDASVFQSNIMHAPTIEKMWFFSPLNELFLTAKPDWHLRSLDCSERKAPKYISETHLWLQCLELMSRLVSPPHLVLVKMYYVIRTLHFSWLRNFGRSNASRSKLCFFKVLGLCNKAYDQVTGIVLEATPVCSVTLTKW